jgi:CRP/FNR family transcriptional regulator
MNSSELQALLPNFTDPNLIQALLDKGQLMHLEPKRVLIESGQFVKMVPIVLEGSIKILRTDEEGKELFLYYLDAGETCALSLTCCTASKPSEIKAVVEESTTLIGIPILVHEQFTVDYKQWKDFVSNTYQRRFHEMLLALDAVAFKRMDERLSYIRHIKK